MPRLRGEAEAASGRGARLPVAGVRSRKMTPKKEREPTPEIAFAFFALLLTACAVALWEVATRLPELLAKVANL